MKQEVRKSNFELMRILSMLLIVFGHFLNILCKNMMLSDSLQIVTNICFAILLMSVNSFVMLSGYFQNDKSMKLSKAIKLNNSVWFYSVLFMIIFMIFGGIQVSKLDFIHTILPLNYSDYWFFTCYIVLYLISPILNVVINNCNKKKMKKIITLLFVLFSIIPYITNQKFIANNGYSIVDFILLYFIGAYLKKYPIEKDNLMKNVPRNKRKIILFFGTFICAAINFLFYYFGTKVVLSSNEILSDIGHIFVDGFWTFSNPLLIIQTILYFIFFSFLNIRNITINKIASYLFGIYLISTNKYVSKWMYPFLGFNKLPNLVGILFYIVLCTLLVFVICMIIEMIRQFIFKAIYNTKFAKKNREWVQKFIKSLGINITW